MTFMSAINSIRDGEATKRASWLGYVYKKPAPDSTEQAPKFDVVIVQKDGAKYVYPFGTQTEPSPTELTKTLLEGFMADDWDRGTIEAFEKARTGGDF